MRHTYVVAPRIRWQGMLENPLCSFWGQELSEVWSGTEVETRKTKQQPLLLPPLEMPTKVTKGWLADDPEMKAVYPVTIEMERRAKVVEEHLFENSGYVIMEDAESRLRWVKRVY